MLWSAIGQILFVYSDECVEVARGSFFKICLLLPVVLFPVDPQNHVLSLVDAATDRRLRRLPSSASFHWRLQCISCTKGDGPWPVVSMCFQ